MLDGTRGGAETARNCSIPPPHWPNVAQLRCTCPIWSGLRPAGRRPSQTTHRRTEARCRPTVCPETAVLWPGSRVCSRKYCAHTIPLHRMETPDGHPGRGKKCRKTAQSHLHTVRVGHNYNLLIQYGQDCVRQTDPRHARPERAEHAPYACRMPENVRAGARHLSRRPDILRPHHPTPSDGDAGRHPGRGKKCRKTAQNHLHTGVGGHNCDLLTQYGADCARPDGAPPKSPSRTESALQAHGTPENVRAAPKHIVPTPFHPTRWRPRTGTWGGARNGGKRPKPARTWAWAATATPRSPSMDQITPGRTAPHQSRPAGQKALRMPTVCPETAVPRRAPA